MLFKIKYFLGGSKWPWRLLFLTSGSSVFFFFFFKTQCRNQHISRPYNVVFVDSWSRDGFGRGNCIQVKLNCTSLGLPAICKTPVFVMISECVPKPERNAHFINNIPGTFQDLQERGHQFAVNQKFPKGRMPRSSALKAPKIHLHLVFSFQLTGLS